VKMKNGYCILSSNEAEAICHLISNVDADPREVVRDSINELYGTNDPAGKEVLRAFQQFLDDTGIGYNMAFDADEEM
jgi:hypothetical protein